MEFLQPFLISAFAFAEDERTIRQEVSDYMVRPPLPLCTPRRSPPPNHRHPPPVKNKALGA